MRGCGWVSDDVMYRCWGQMIICPYVPRLVVVDDPFGIRRMPAMLVGTENFLSPHANVGCVPRVGPLHRLVCVVRGWGQMIICPYVQRLVVVDDPFGRRRMPVMLVGTENFLSPHANVGCVPRRGNIVWTRAGRSRVGTDDYLSLRATVDCCGMT